MGGAFVVGLVGQFARYRRTLRLNPLIFESSDPGALRLGRVPLRIHHGQWRITHLDAKTTYTQVTTRSGNAYNRISTVAYEPHHYQEARIVATDGRVSTWNVPAGLPVQVGDAVALAGLWRIGADGTDVYVRNLLAHSYATGQRQFNPLPKSGYLWKSPTSSLLYQIEIVGKLIGIAFTILTFPVMLPVRLIFHARLRHVRKKQSAMLESHVMKFVISSSEPAFSESG